MIKSKKIEKKVIITLGKNMEEEKIKKI